MRAFASVVRQQKALRPSDYCAAKDCLWRVQTRNGPTPCPRHPGLPTTPFPGYDVRAMTYHGGSVQMENTVDARFDTDDADIDAELREQEEIE
jgi:hypothetical protein